MTRQFFIGFDEALANSGWCVMELMTDTGELVYVESGVFHPTIKWGWKSDCIIFLEHRYHIKTLLNRISAMGDILAIAMEGVAFSAPGQAASRGGVFALYSTMSVFYGDLITISPTSMKKFISGFGFAEKEDIKRDVRSMHPEVPDELAFDIYDAVGLCEIGFLAYLITHGREEHVKSRIGPEKFLMLRNNNIVKKTRKVKPGAKKSGKKSKSKSSKPDKMKGICDRVDDLYIAKRSPE